VLGQWEAKYPGLTLGQVLEREPDLAMAVAEAIEPAASAGHCVRLTANVLTEFYVNLATGELETISLDPAGYDPDEFDCDELEDLSEEDQRRARNIASSLGHHA
jgi:hypothetical protein